MPATCAICLQPITTGNDVRVSGTEVMHRGCAMSGRETIRQRQQRQLAELQGALVAAQEGERRQMALYQQARLRADRSKDAARLADERVDNAGVERDEAVSRRVRAEIARDLAIRERDTARAELSKRAQAPDVAPPTLVDDQEDGTSIRFGLLELD